MTPYRDRNLDKTQINTMYHGQHFCYQVLDVRITVGQDEESTNPDVRSGDVSHIRQSDLA